MRVYWMSAYLYTLEILMDNLNIRPQLVRMVKTGNVDTLPLPMQYIMDKLPFVYKDHMTDEICYGATMCIALLACVAPPSLHKDLELAGQYFLYLWWKRYKDEVQNDFPSELPYDVKT